MKLIHKIVTISVSIFLAYPVTVGKVLAETMPDKLTQSGFSKPSNDTAQLRLVESAGSVKTPAEIHYANFQDSIKYLRTRNLIGVHALPVEDLSYMNVIDSSPGFALTGVRREMEIHLNHACQSYALPGEKPPLGVSALVRDLHGRGAIPAGKAGALLKLNSCLNVAVHGEEEWMASPVVRTWLKEESPRLLQRLIVLLRIIPK
ncbi:MAG TPA: hypothetical protein V6C86_07525 [Oculatellaceae cyanobacterium]